MADQSHHQPKAPVPRKLEQRETLQNLNHWRNTFVNYYRRCQFYGIFLIPGTTWTTSGNRGFSHDETGGLKRNVQTLASDLEGFLSCLAGYLPFDYVAEKLADETTCMQDVWEIVYEIYDAEVNTVNFLDYASMKREPQESGDLPKLLQPLGWICTTTLAKNSH